MSAYSAGVTLAFFPDVNGTAGPVSVNVNGLGAKAIKLADGTSNPLGSSIVSGGFYQISYDGTVFRIPDGFDPTKSGAALFDGFSSGSVSLAVADVAGTAITYVLPSTNGTAAKVLSDSGVTTCPTLPAGYPSTCHLMQWVDRSVPIASGTAAMGTSSIAAGTCATVVTVSAPGVATTDRIVFTPNASIKAVTGYNTLGTLTITAYPDVDSVNFDVCNRDQTNAVTPGAVTLNWGVTR